MYPPVTTRWATGGCDPLAGRPRTTAMPGATTPGSGRARPTQPYPSRPADRAAPRAAGRLRRRRGSRGGACPRPWWSRIRRARARTRVGRFDAIGSLQCYTEGAGRCFRRTLRFAVRSRLVLDGVVQLASSLVDGVLGQIGLGEVEMRLVGVRGDVRRDRSRQALAGGRRPAGHELADAGEERDAWIGGRRGLGQRAQGRGRFAVAPGDVVGHGRVEAAGRRRLPARAADRT